MLDAMRDAGLRLRRGIQKPSCPSCVLRYATMQRSEADTAPDDVDAFDASGVDVTQIDMMLAMTPVERLQALYETAASLARLMPDADTD